MWCHEGEADQSLGALRRILIDRTVPQQDGEEWDDSAANSKELVAWCATNGQHILSRNTDEVVVYVSSDTVYKLYKHSKIQTLHSLPNNLVNKF